jgi:hypothetical protein
MMPPDKIKEETIPKQENIFSTSEDKSTNLNQFKRQKTAVGMKKVLLNTKTSRV